LNGLLTRLINPCLESYVKNQSVNEKHLIIDTVSNGLIRPIQYLGRLTLFAKTWSEDATKQIGVDLDKFSLINEKVLNDMRQMNEDTGNFSTNFHQQQLAIFQLQLIESLSEAIQSIENKMKDKRSTPLEGVKRANIAFDGKPIEDSAQLSDALNRILSDSEISHADKLSRIIIALVTIINSLNSKRTTFFSSGTATIASDILKDLVSSLNISITQIAKLDSVFKNISLSLNGNPTSVSGIDELYRILGKVDSPRIVPDEGMEDWVIIQP
jgi:hypothetical protein